jgi:hypothetical protein
LEASKELLKMQNFKKKQHMNIKKSKTPEEVKVEE